MSVSTGSTRKRAREFLQHHRLYQRRYQRKLLPSRWPSRLPRDIRLRQHLQPQRHLPAHRYQLRLIRRLPRNPCLLGPVLKDKPHRRQLHLRRNLPHNPRQPEPKLLLTLLHYPRAAGPNRKQAAQNQLKERKTLRPFHILHSAILSPSVTTIFPAGVLSSSIITIG